MKPRTLKLLFSAAGLMLLSSCQPAATRSVVELPNGYRVIKKAEAREAERWIFEQVINSNAAVIMEAIVEYDRITGAMQGTRFSFGWCGTGSGGTTYFQSEHLGDARVLHLPMSAEDMAGRKLGTNDCPASLPTPAIDSIPTGAVAGAVVEYRFGMSTRISHIYSVFSQLASNQAARIILVPEHNPHYGTQVTPMRAPPRLQPRGETQ